MNLQQLKDKLLQNHKIKAEFEKNDLAFDISEQIIDARIKAGLTQNELAKIINTKQSGIARAENGTRLPNISFLNKIAEALNVSFSIKINPNNSITKIDPTAKSSEDIYKIDRISIINNSNLLIKTTVNEIKSIKISNFNQIGEQK